MVTPTSKDAAAITYADECPNARTLPAGPMCGCHPMRGRAVTKRAAAAPRTPVGLPEVDPLDGLVKALQNVRAALRGRTVEPEAHFFAVSPSFN